MPFTKKSRSKAAVVEVALCRPGSLDVSRHKITDDWEAAEMETVAEIEKDRKEGSLGGVSEGTDAPGHCVYRDALVVPDSGGRFKTFFSDGRMSRVSMKHHDLTKPPGQQCIGG